MTSTKSLDPRYRINIEIGMRVMIKEENNLELIPGYVKEIITQDHLNESGIIYLPLLDAPGCAMRACLMERKRSRDASPDSLTTSSI